MDCKELLIGNYALDCKNEVFIVHDGVTIDTANHPKYGFNPVPLNEEWLEKLGFRYIIELDVFTKYAVIGVSTSVQLKKCQFSFTTLFNNGMIEVKYVHQLQNLFFALTGIELKTEEDGTV